MHKFVLYTGAPLNYSWRVACSVSPPLSKTALADFWNAEPCGTRYLGEKSEFEAQARARYQLEPHIFKFAGFESARGLRVLEIGVGMGADYVEWLQAGAIATGVDLSPVSLERAQRRCKLAGLAPDLRLADAENLPFAANSFDIVYSYGVMHHSPDPAKCVNEAWRVLKPGGEVRVMLYHHVSLTGIMLWLRFGLWRGQSIRQSVYQNLENPGTKTFTRNEVFELTRDFENVSIDQVFSPGDLLLHNPSRRFRSAPYRLLWKLFPRIPIRRAGKRWALFLLIKAMKPRTH